MGLMGTMRTMKTAAERWTKNQGQRTPTAHELPRGLLVMQLAGGSEKASQTEAVCEFFIFSNLPTCSDPKVVADRTTLAQFGQNPLERR